MHITSNNNHTNIYIVDNIFRLNYNKKYIINYKLVECLKPAVQNTIVYLHVLINNVRNRLSASMVSWLLGLELVA